MKNLEYLISAFAIPLILLCACEDENETPIIPTDPDLAEVKPTPCDSLSISPVNLWLFQQITDWSEGAVEVLGNEEVAKMAILTAIFSENIPENQYYGVNGEYTAQLNNAFKELKFFWNGDYDNIVMAAAHGSFLGDRDRILTVYKAEYGYSDEKANYHTDSIRAFIETYPEYLNGNHPFFTSNAYAHQEKEYPSAGKVPDKIVFGDAFLQAFEAIGFGEIAPQAVLAHEFAHHIQYDLGIKDYNIPLTPEGNRRTELMADAYAAYFLSHNRGGAMQWENLQLVAELFSYLGDCNFESELHHGTPDQRKSATKWGYDLATATHRVDILSVTEFANRFDAALDNIVKNE